MNDETPKEPQRAPFRQLSNAKLVFWLILTISAVLFAIWLCDRPIAYAAHAHLAPYKSFFAALTHIVDLFQFAAGAIACWLLTQAARGRFFSPVEIASARLAGALYVSMGLKDQLKYVFGRAWPETWVAGNPSLIKDGAFGFFPFHGTPAWASFPSGHEAETCAVIVCAALLWPQSLKFIWIVIPIVGVGLIGANYHFLSDVLAGGALGALVGAAAARIGEARCPSSAARS